MHGADEGVPAKPARQPATKRGREKPPGRHLLVGSRSARRHPPAALYGAIDLGTNNCRLLIARAISHDRFRVVDAFSRIVRLGDDLVGLGAISEAAMERAIAALHICAERLSRLEVKSVRSVATEACRSASNGPDFVERVFHQTGIALDVISPAQEARLAVLGCEALIDRSLLHTLVFDIGGGSTEVVVLERHSNSEPPARPGKARGEPGGAEPPRGGRFPCCQEVRAWLSVPWGVASLTSTEAGTAENSTARRAAYQRMRERVRTELAPLKRFIGKDMQIVGTSGTVTTLASLSMGLERYDRRRVDGAVVDARSLVALGHDLMAKSVVERAAIPGVGPDRAELIVAGSAILEALVDLSGARELRVADRGIREGILRGLIARDMGMSVSAWVK